MKRHVWKIDLLVILFSIGILMWAVGYARPLVIAPIDGMASSGSQILFDFDKADVLLIDDNIDFTTPDEYNVVGGLKISLEPGVYYWKVKGIFGSEIRTLTINSVVDLELVETENGISVVNIGNTLLNVDVYDGDELVEKRKLDVGEVSSEGNKFVGAQDG